MTRRDGAVWLGGALGTVARAGTAQLVPVTTWPWATFSVNVVGTLLLGLLVGWATGRVEPDSLWPRFLATGVLGSFTTFSTFAVEVRALGFTGHGLSYGVASVAAGLVVARVGMGTARIRMVDA